MTIDETLRRALQALSHEELIVSLGAALLDRRCDEGAIGVLCDEVCRRATLLYREKPGANLMTTPPETRN